MQRMTELRLDRLADEAGRRVDLALIETIAAREPHILVVSPKKATRTS